ncbi:hypothetical protein J6590_103237 [Homalodisca vitripennis]|nr:hypothetical protein J6590_103237 [Homalodisca vitripennis]
MKTMGLPANTDQLINIPLAISGRYDVTAGHVNTLHFHLLSLLRDNLYNFSSLLCTSGA